jgi:ABC-2 type transport system permease protein
VERGYGAATQAGARAQVQLIVDGSDSASAVIGLGYTEAIVAQAGAELVRRQARARGLDAPAAARVELVPRVWYNPDLKSRWFYVPAILALTLMLLTMILPSMAVVREKEIGTLEHLIVTPIRPWQLIVGKLLPFFVIGILDLALVSAVAVYVFGVPLRGSFAALTLLTLPFLLTMLGLGLLASTLVRTQQQAMMGSTFVVMMPMIYLSGLIFPIENMPEAMQLVTYALPLRYYATIIRGVFLKSAGVGVLWPEALMLTGFGALALTVASLRFRKSLD